MTRLQKAEAVLRALMDVNGVLQRSSTDLEKATGYSPRSLRRFLERLERDGKGKRSSVPGNFVRFEFSTVSPANAPAIPANAPAIPANAPAIPANAPAIPANGRGRGGPSVSLELLGKAAAAASFFEKCSDETGRSAPANWPELVWPELVDLLLLFAPLARLVDAVARASGLQVDDESQRAMVAARAKVMFEAAAMERQKATQIRDGKAPAVPANLPGPGEARGKAAALVNVSPRSVENACVVLKKGDEKPVSAPPTTDEETAIDERVAQIEEKGESAGEGLRFKVLQDLRRDPKALKRLLASAKKRAEKKAKAEAKAAAAEAVKNRSAAERAAIGERLLKQAEEERAKLPRSEGFASRIGIKLFGAAPEVRSVTPAANGIRHYDGNGLSDIEEHEHDE